MKNNNLKSFRDLKVWQKASDLCVLVYKITEEFPKSEIYGIINQMRRASLSIASNLAEGFKRSHKKEKLQFYNIAHSSSAELENQIEISYKLEFLSKERYQELINKVVEVSKMINGLIKSLNPQFSILNSREGQSLIEVLLIVTLVTVVIAGNVSFLARSYSITEFVAGQTAATYLAAEGLEIVKNMIDANCLEERTWDKIGPGSSGQYKKNMLYEVDFLSRELEEITGSGRNLLFDPLESGGTNFYGYYHSVLTSADAEETPYKRTIKIEPMSGNQGQGSNYAIKVFSNVNWTSRQGEFDVNLTGIFYDLCELRSGK